MEDLSRFVPRPAQGHGNIQDGVGCPLAGVRYQIINPLHESNWNQWILTFGGACYFHTAEWARVLTETYRYPVYYGILEYEGQVVGLLPVMDVNSLLTGHRGVCLPFSDQCAPLLKDGIAPAALIEPMLEFGRRRGWAFLEIRGGYIEAQAPGEPCELFMVHELALEPTEDLQYQKLKESHRRNIRKAQKEGIEIHRLQSLEAVRIYYALHCLTRRRHGLPPQPWRFFLNLFNCVIAADQGFVLLARHEDRWIAGAVYFVVGHQALYKYGASDMRYQHLRPNNLLMWEAIRHFRQLGLTSLSLGRSEPYNTGLLRFKRGWGAAEQRLPYYRIGLRKRLRPIGMEQADGKGLVHKLLQKLPLSVLRLLGALAYRHMG